MKRPLLVGLLILTNLSLVHASEWPRFRGINGSGVNENAEIPVEWTDKDILFDVELPGTGNGSPVVHGKRVFLLCADEETFERMPVCLDAQSGEILWQDKVQTGKFKGHRFNSPASSTAAVDDEQVYFSWGTKEELTIAAYTHDGERVWSRGLGPVVGGHGFGASPAVYEELVVINNDQDKANGSLIALNKATGKTEWEIDRNGERLSYSTPCEVSVGGKTFLVFTNWQHGFTVVDPANGDVVDELSPFDLTTNERAISSPIAFGDIVVGTCGFTANPKHCVAVRVDEKGKLEEIWRIERSVPHIPSPLLVGDLLFLWDDKGILTCVDPMTGEEHYRERVPTRGTCFGSPVSDGKTIFSIDDGGNVHAVAASKEFKVLGMTALKDVCRSTPAIANGNLYLRTNTRLVAIKGKAVTG
ncbi:MAG: PQQ-binding-like beta-propeller repeat protein [Verrucomicrobiota bacterium]